MPTQNSKILTLGELKNLKLVSTLKKLNSIDQYKCKHVTEGFFCASVWLLKKFQSRFENFFFFKNCFQLVYRLSKDQAPIGFYSGNKK